MNLDGVVPLGYCGVIYQLGKICFGLLELLEHILALYIKVIRHHSADVCSTYHNGN